ncbi:branched-chain amino acid ABC transporter permease [Nocardia sp. NPDC051030]|uniref:branched-chain amino acid ABC transporter permease n=1 Tax=Nocardia sp. NPDC051030 TaxID=3155162 RepID=UPI003432FC1C
MIDRRVAVWTLVGVVAVIAMLGLQSQLYTGQERVVTSALMFVALAQAWNIIGGLTGYACFGQVGFFGIGGYTTAVLMAKAHWSFWAALPVSALGCAVFAALIGFPLLRLRGHYFAIATLGTAEGMREVVTNLGGLTGGGSGITVPTIAGRGTPWLGNDGFYLLFLGLAAVSVLSGALVSHSRFGYGLRAINQDEDAAAAAGINTTVSKVIALVISAAITGLVGSAYAFQQVTIFPQRLFDVDITVLMIIMVVLGGAGTVIGPVLGAVGLQFVSEYLRDHYPSVHIFVLGSVIVVAVLLFPMGVVTFARDAIAQRRIPLLDTIRAYRL